MSGRGCTVVVQLLHPSGAAGTLGAAGGGGDDLSEDISLQVALHTPLGIFKSRLQDICGIFPGDQVLILCDLTDPDRNNDTHLGADYDNISLRDCRIRANSVLTLHALGVSAEKRAALLKDAADQKEAQKEALRKKTEGTAVLNTPVTAAQADHSFNGIIFDLQPRGAHELSIYSLSVAGMLGRVRIFARDRSWEKDLPNSNTQHHWGHHPGVSQDGWTLVADQVCRPSWDRPTEIFFTTPFRILPHQTRGFYIHSGLPDDLGIQYRSCKPDTMVCEDTCLRVMPGLGHCGSRPFDHVNGWYRHGRSPCGSIRYKATLKGWNKNEHHSFPEPMREAVVAMLASFYSAVNAHSPYSSSSPRYVPGHARSGFTDVATATEVEWGSPTVATDAVTSRTPATDLDSMSIAETQDSSRALSSATGSGSGNGARPKKEARKTRTDSEEEAYLMEQADRGEEMDAMFGEAAEEEEEEEGAEDLQQQFQEKSSNGPLAAGAGPSPSSSSSSSSVTTAFSSGGLSLNLPGTEGAAPAVTAREKRPALSIINEKYLIYHIMSFCHWDWFEEVEIARRKEAAKLRRVQARENASSAAEARRARGGMATRSTTASLSGESAATATGLSRVNQMRAMVAQVLTSYGVEDVTEDIITMFMSNMLANQEQENEDDGDGDEDMDDYDYEEDESGEEDEEGEDEIHADIRIGTSMAMGGDGDNEDDSYEEESDEDEDSTSMQMQFGGFPGGFHGGFVDEDTWRDDDDEEGDEERVEGGRVQELSDSGEEEDAGEDMNTSDA